MVAEGARQGLCLSPTQVFCAASQAQVNQMFKLMISRLKMKYSSSGQRENREVSKASGITDGWLN